MDAELFWNNVKAQIKSQNTTQEWLCNECNLVLSSFRNRISLKRFPTVDEAYLIAQALDTTVEYLVTGVDSNPAEIELRELKAKLKNFTSSL